MVRLMKTLIPVTCHISIRQLTIKSNGSRVVNDFTRNISYYDTIPGLSIFIRLLRGTDSFIENFMHKMTLAGSKNSDWFFQLFSRLYAWSGPGIPIIPYFGLRIKQTILVI